ncbi:class I SAM-dependent methyltransferase [Leptospira sp. 96542]|nr:class I SAM-dependent methyltransferase [Leptospira sp. 96542]
MKMNNLRGLHVRAWKKLWRKFERAMPAAGAHFCVCCGEKVFRFLPYGSGKSAEPLVGSMLDMVGSDIEHYECPRCGASDRERHLYMYCRHLGLDKRMHGAKILHFAPELHFSNFIKSMEPSEYVRADLFPRDSAVQKMNIQEIPYPDASFDFVIANHVLEHVANDGVAVREISRILKQGGVAILQTPYSAMLENTFEDQGIVSEAAREFAYGQNDHVRLFGRDIFSRLGRFGLSARVQEHAILSSAVDARVHGVNPREPFFLFERTN